MSEKGNACIKCQWAIWCDDPLKGRIHCTSMDIMCCGEMMNRTKLYKTEGNYLSYYCSVCFTEHLVLMDRKKFEKKRYTGEDDFYL
jgi:hypothetical protein